MKTILIQKKDKKIKLIIKKNELKSSIIIKGPLGSISYDFSNAKLNDNEQIFVEYRNINFLIKKLKKLIKSVTLGWFLELNLNGLGYKSFKLDDKIALDLGYSNLILYKPTDKIKIRNFKNKIVLFSVDQEYLYNVASNLRSYSPPDPYKGKGILKKNEIIKLKKKAKS